MYREDFLAFRAIGSASQPLFYTRSRSTVIVPTLAGLTSLLFYFMFLVSYPTYVDGIGQLLPGGQATTITSPATGRIVETFVREEQAVRMGQSLFRMHLSESNEQSDKASLKYLESSLENTKKSVEAMHSERSIQRTSYRRRSNELLSQIVIVDKSIELQRSIVDQESRTVEKLKDLVDRGYYGKINYLREIASLEKSRQDLNSLINSKSSLEYQKAQLDAEFGSYLANFRRALDENMVQQISFLEQSSLLRLNSERIVRAPIDGQFRSTKALRAAEIPQGVIIATVTAKGGRRFLEGYFPPGVLGRIGVGAKAKIALEAFPYQRYGYLNAELASIQVNQERQDVAVRQSITVPPQFKVKVLLEIVELPADIPPSALEPGMSAVVRIPVRAESLFTKLVS